MTTTIIGGKDRCDYRAMSNQELVEEAKYTPNIELCIALGERLHDMQRKLEAYRYDYEAERNGYDY
jgi:hypothetical protein